MEDYPSDISQKDAVLRHLRKYGHITPLKALVEYGCMRLAAVIHELRKEGYTIVTLKKSSISRITGRKVYFADYAFPYYREEGLLRRLLHRLKWILR